MGRKALKLEKIEDKQKRTVTFCKRSKGLFKKAKTFCDAFPGAQIAVITFSPLAGKPYTWASTDSSSSSSSVDCIVDRFLLENTKSLGVIQDKGSLQSDDEDKNQWSTSMISEDFEGVPKLDDQSMRNGSNVCDDQNKHGFEEDHQLLVTEENHPINNHGYRCESSICDVNFATTGSIYLDIDQTMNSCGLDFPNQVITSTEGDLSLQMNEYSLDDLLLTREEEAYLEGANCSGTNYQMLLSNSSLPPMLNDGTNGLAWSQGNSEMDEMFVALPQEVFSIDEILASLDD